MSSVTRQKSATENHKCRVQLDKRVERVKELYDHPERGGKPIKFNNNLSGPEITKSEEKLYRA